MNNLNFILLNVTDKNANIIPMYVNKNHIVRIWERDTKIIIEPLITDFQEMAPNGSRGLVNVTHGQVTNMFLMLYQ